MRRTTHRLPPRGALLLGALLAVAPGAARAATLTPTSQVRSTYASATAYTLDAAGTAIDSDFQSRSLFAPGFDAFVATDSVAAQTSVGMAVVAHSNGSVSQDSEILAQGVRAAGAASGSASTTSDGWAGVFCTSLCRLSFSIDAPASGTITATLAGGETAHALAQLLGPSGVLLNVQANEQQPIVQIDEPVDLPAGSYQLELRCSGGASSDRGITVFGESGTFDFLLQFGDAVGVPLPAPGEARFTAFPNPFRVRTTIRAARPGDAPARAEVFDVSGRLVASLRAAPGDALTWDGRGATGRAVPAGTYFIRVDSPRPAPVLKVLALR